MKKAFLKVPYKIFDRRGLWYTPSGRKIKNDRLVKFYLCMLFFSGGGSYHLTRKIKDQVSCYMGLKYGAFWGTLKKLEKNGLAITCKIQSRKLWYSPRKRKKAKKKRRVVRQHKFIKILDDKNYFMLPVKKEMFHKDFNLRGYLEYYARQQSHPEQKIEVPKLCRSTHYKVIKRHNEFLNPVSYCARDTFTKVKVNSTNRKNCLFKGADYSLIVLLHRKTPDDPVKTIKIPWYKTKKVWIGDRKRLAHNGILYIPVEGKRLMYERIFKKEKQPREKIQPKFFITNNPKIENQKQFTFERLRLDNELLHKTPLEQAHIIIDKLKKKSRAKHSPSLHFKKCQPCAIQRAVQYTFR